MRANHKRIIKRDYEVVIGAEGRPMKLLGARVSRSRDNSFYRYNINYSKYLPATTSLIFQIPKIFWNIKRENKIFRQKSLMTIKSDGVISDSRFGLYTKKFVCILNASIKKIKSPFFEKYFKI